MYLSMENLKITEVETENGKYKGNKFVKHKNPIEVSKVIFEDEYTNLMDIASEIKHASERNPHNKIRVSFEVNAEY